MLLETRRGETDTLLIWNNRSFFLHNLYFFCFFFFFPAIMTMDFFFPLQYLSYEYPTLSKKVLEDEGRRGNKRNAGAMFLPTQVDLDCLPFISLVCNSKGNSIGIKVYAMLCDLLCEFQGLCNKPRLTQCRQCDGTACLLCHYREGGGARHLHISQERGDG